MWASSHYDQRNVTTSTLWESRRIISRIIINHADGIVSIDLFVVPTLSFRLLYGLLVLRHDRRRILWLGVTTHPTAEWVARQVTVAFGWETAPSYLWSIREACYRLSGGLAGG